MTTKRQFDTIRISIDLPADKHMKRFEEILKRHGTKIKRLKWEKSVLNLQDCENFFNLLPNLEELVIRKWNLLIEFTDTITFNMPKLKKLAITDCSFDIVLLLNKFRVNALREVVFDGERIECLEFFERLQNVKKIKTRKQLRLNQQQKLTHLCFEPWMKEEDVVDVLRLIKSQNELVFLEVMPSYRLIGKHHLMSSIMEELCMLRQLQVLKIDIEHIVFERFKSIQYLHNLRTLQLSAVGYASDFDKSNERDLMRKLMFLSSAMSNMPLTSLSLLFPHSVVEGRVIKELGKNLGRVNHLTVNAKFYNLNDVLDYFSRLESLDATYTCHDSKQLNYYGSSTFLTLHYPNLTSLKLDIIEGRSTCFKDSKRLLQLFDDLPNLEKLNLSVNIPFAPQFFESIFVALPKLKSLSYKQHTFPERCRIDLEKTAVAKLFYRRGKNLTNLTIEDHARELLVHEAFWISLFHRKYEIVEIGSNRRRIYMEKFRPKSVSIYDDPFV